MFHPRPAKWFDIMVPQSELSATLAALAGSHAVELEGSTDPSYHAVDVSSLRDDLNAYRELERRYQAHWPAADNDATLSTGSAHHILSASLAQCRQWALAAVPHIGTLQCAVRQEANLKHLRELAAAAGPDFPVHLLSEKHSVLFEVSIHLLEHGAPPQSVPEGLSLRTYQTSSGLYLLAIGEKASIDKLTADLGNLKARHIDMSAIRDAIASNRMKALAALAKTDLLGTIDAYIQDQRHRQAQETKLISKLSARYHLSLVRAHADHLRWLVGQVSNTVNTRYFTRITGWTACSEEDLRRVLAMNKSTAALSVSAAPKGSNPPLLFNNPPWAQPFEAFVRLLGMPSQGEADPSVLVALIAPLLFGFMFGDVGQGLVLVVAGLALRRTWPSAAILVPGGLMAMVFGFAFGSVFAREDIIDALWLHPLVNPVPILSIALGAGVAVLLTGLALSGAGAHWQGLGRTWWATRAGLGALYVGVLLSFASPWGQVLMALGGFWFLAGTAIVSVQKGASFEALDFAQAVPAALGELVESLFQILINTLSFVRVGAFAIAHAGLSSALVVLADIAGDSIGFWIVMIVGNVFIIALEGLVAGIQTTRLILFEFFIRFLRAEGRPLRVLPTPAEWSLKLEGKPS
jgi:V/A-type H+-transporting ATPase subunit I